MYKKRVIRYFADCGKGFWSKQSTIKHEQKCTCWTNPKLRTCKTCVFGNIEIDSNGMDAPYLETWAYYDCTNPKFIEATDFTPAHKTNPTLCINCPKWENKKT